MTKQEKFLVVREMTSYQLMDKLVEYGGCLESKGYTELEKIEILETVEIIKNELSDRLAGI